MVQERRKNNLPDILGELASLDELDNAVALLTNRHPADQAELLDQLDVRTRGRLLSYVSPAQLARILEFLSEDGRSRFLSEFSANALAPVLNRMEHDRAADIVQELPAPQAEAVIPLLRERKAVEELLGYPEDSAGGRMTRNFVALKDAWTVEDAIRFLRRQRPDVIHPFYLYVTDDAGHLTGVVAMRSILTAEPRTPIAAIKVSDVISVPVSVDQETAAERMRHYNLLALPVVDEQNRLEGVISADDVLDVQVEEATEDMYRLAGVYEEETALTPLARSLRARVPWLLVNLVTAFFAASVVAPFQSTISRVAALAVFMPVIAGHGGNTGTQVATIVVRSLATGQVRIRDAWPILRKELGFGLVHGLLAGGCTAAYALLLNGNPWLGLVVVFAMVANVMMAGLVGSLIPLLLTRLGQDPALASAIWLTTFTDMFGFLVLLGSGTLLISRLT